MLEAHKGAISVASEPEKGAPFTINLPKNTMSKVQTISRSKSRYR